jgi:hypothetical protein
MEHGKTIWDSIRGAKAAVGWQTTSPAASAWWAEFERINFANPSLVLSLLLELCNRSRTIEEFFITYLNSNLDGIQENLDFLDLVVKHSPACGRLDKQAFDRFCTIAFANSNKP